MKTMDIGPYTYEEFLELARKFHGYPAPGLIIGAYMVERAKTSIPEGTLYNAVAETGWCLPDAIQMLTPCTIGNGWMMVLPLGLYAVGLYDKYSGRGVRVFLDHDALGPYPEIRAWYLKLKTKDQQDSGRLLDEIRTAGDSICSVAQVMVRPEYIAKREKGPVALCPVCHQAYPTRDGAICRFCQGESPYENELGDRRVHTSGQGGPALTAVPVADAVGRRVLHDMTRIVPGESKGAEFRKGHRVAAGDLCRLQQMGRRNIYTEDAASPGDEWVHENDAASAFGAAMAGEGVEVLVPPREGKINLTASRDGLFVVDDARMEQFNLLPDVMVASRHDSSVVKRGTNLAGTRAIPLFLSRDIFGRAQSLLSDGPLFRVLPIKPAAVGILVTGNEVYEGLIKDKFAPIISRKVKAYGCCVLKTIIVPDERQAVKDGITDLTAAGCDLIVTTAGLSVDPDDVTRQGIIDAGAADILYGAPVLPGAMSLFARNGKVRVIGVPACALFFRTTAFDLLLPRVLAGVEITRRDLAKLGHGGLCHECRVCTYPKCAFGK